MANEEQLAILKQSAEKWNAWRRVYPDITPNLYKANLQGVDLQGVDLQGADLYGTNLQGANLQWADLEITSLKSANLKSASLKNANLQGANLETARLQGANLESAKLQGANLKNAKLQGANLMYASVSSTIFGNLDLRVVYGLDTVQHRGPSTIGIDTLYKSHGEIPESFLRGCGVPDSMIEYARSLVAAVHPIDYYSTFISYSSHDTALAERLYADLQAKGVRCWLAPHHLTPGEVIVRGIDEAIRLHDKVVLLLSKAAVMSHWVAYEVNLAITREAREGRMVLYPLRLDDTVLTTTQGWAASLREGRHIGDFRKWTEYAAYQAVFGRLLRDLKAEQR